MTYWGPIKEWFSSKVPQHRKPRVHVACVAGGISRVRAFVLVAKPWTRVAKPWEDWWRVQASPLAKSLAGFMAALPPRARPLTNPASYAGYAFTQCMNESILVPRAHDPSGLWQGSRALGRFPFDHKFRKFRVGERMEQSFFFGCTSRGWPKIPENRNSRKIPFHSTIPARA